MKIPKVMAYRRENGRVGVRNHVVILPLDDLSNSACEAVGNNIKGTLALPHAYGRLQFGEDLELFFRTIIGTGKNPKVAAVVVIGIEPDWTDRIVRGIAETGKPVKGFSIERAGDINTIAAASRQAKGDEVSPADLPPAPRGPGERPAEDASAEWPPLPADGLSLVDLEKRLIERALRLKGGNITQAAAYLRIPRHILVHRLEKYGIRRDG